MAYLFLGVNDCLPHPCYAGEFIDNGGKYEHSGAQYFNGMVRQGRPRPTRWYTSKELAAEGMVGLYLTQNVSPRYDLGEVVLIDTPKSLKEPRKPTHRQRSKLHAIRHKRHAERRSTKKRAVNGRSTS